MVWFGSRDGEGSQRRTRKEKKYIFLVKIKQKKPARKREHNNTVCCVAWCGREIWNVNKAAGFRKSTVAT
jgi:hypothetical protein